MEGLGLLVDNIGHDELVRMVLAQTEMLSATQTQQALMQRQFSEQQQALQQQFASQIAQLTTQVSLIAQAQTQGRTDLDRLTNWQTWGIRLLLGFFVLALVGYFIGDRIVAP